MIRTIDSPEGPRTVLAVRPHAGSPPWPMIVFLPGTGGTAEWAADETRLLDAAPAAGFLLVVPEGRRPDPESPPKFITNRGRAGPRDHER
jgi:poly(3-hydroxybutyrate) depolymerase